MAAGTQQMVTLLSWRCKTILSLSEVKKHKALKEGEANDVILHILLHSIEKNH